MDDVQAGGSWRSGAAVGGGCWLGVLESWRRDLCLLKDIYIGTDLGFKFLVPYSDPSRNVWILNFNTQNHFIYIRSPNFTWFELARSGPNLVLASFITTPNKYIEITL